MMYNLTFIVSDYAIDGDKCILKVLECVFMIKRLNCCSLVRLQILLFPKYLL